MLKIVRPKFSTKEYIMAWCDRKNYNYYTSGVAGDGLVLTVYKPSTKKGWFGREYTDEDEVLSYHYYAKIGKKVAAEIGDDCEGKKLYWLKAKPAYFNLVEVLAEEIENEIEEKDRKIVLVTMVK